MWRLEYTGGEKDDFGDMCSQTYACIVYDVDVLPIHNSTSTEVKWVESSFFLSMSCK